MIQIKDERDYVIRKGKILEKITSEFYDRHRKNHMFLEAIELLLRGVDPYEVIERMIEVNDDLVMKMNEMIPYLHPDYSLKKSKQ